MTIDFAMFLKRLPIADIGIPELTVRVLTGEQSVALIEVSEDAIVPPHSHGDQWGIVLSGKLKLTMNDRTTELRAGDTYLIPAGTEHGANIQKGTRLIEFFEESHRFVV